LGAWDAATAVRIVITRLEKKVPVETVLKKGLVNASPAASCAIYAACPIYASSKHGKAKTSHEI